jgi:hypothetical protein
VQWQVASTVILLGSGRFREAHRNIPQRFIRSNGGYAALLLLLLHSPQLHRPISTVRSSPRQITCSRSVHPPLPYLFSLSSNHFAPFCLLSLNSFQIQRHCSEIVNACLLSSLKAKNFTMNSYSPTM